MIVREILNKDFDIDTFDHFNDSKDTLMWLRAQLLFPQEKVQPSPTEEVYSEASVGVLLTMIKRLQYELRYSGVSSGKKFNKLTLIDEARKLLDALGDSELS